VIVQGTESEIFITITGNDRKYTGVVGKGTVIITGDGENYYGQKKVTFLILPKWAMWIW